MKVDVTIKVSDSTDPEASVAATFHECDPNAIMADPKLELVQPILQQFLKIVIGDPNNQ